jgi:chorismate mutase
MTTEKTYNLNHLNDLRLDLENIDKDILLTVKKRFDMITQIAEVKKHLNLEILQEQHFNNKLANRIEEANILNIDAELVTDLYHLLHQYAIKKQRSLQNETQNQ